MALSSCWEGDQGDFTKRFMAHMTQLHKKDAGAGFPRFLKSRMAPIAAIQAEALFWLRRPAYMRAWFDAARRHFTARPGKRVVEMERNGVVLRGDLGQYIPLWVFVMGSFEPELVRLAAGWLGPGDIVLDIGAYIGSFALPLAAKSGVVVHCAEPNPGAFDLLQHNVAANGMEGVVRPLQVAICEENGPAELSIPQAHDSMAALGRRADDEGGGGVAGVAVAGVRFEEFWRLAHEPRPALIKIDVEGVETAVLRQMAPLLRDAAPALIIEVNPGWLDANVLMELLWGLNYRVYWITRRTTRLLAAPPDGPGNIWCVPAQRRGQRAAASGG